MTIATTCMALLPSYASIGIAAPILLTVLRIIQGIAISGELNSAVVPAILAEKFPTQVRNSGSSIAYNSSLALFGGSAPLISLTLVELTASNLAPAWYLILSALLGLIALFYTKETYSKSLI